MSASCFCRFAAQNCAFYRLLTADPARRLQKNLVGIPGRNLEANFHEVPRLRAGGAFSLGVTVFCNRNGLIPVTFFGVDTFLYAWMTMSTLAHWSTAHATVMTTLPANSSDNCTRWWQRLCAAVVRAVRPERI